MENKVETLEDLCIENISRNLSLNYDICKALYNGMPNRLAEKIYDMSFFTNSIISQSDIRFFNKEIMNLKNVDINRKQFCTLIFYDFLNNHNLDNLSIGCDFDFNLIFFNDFKLNTKNLYVGFNDPYCIDDNRLLFENLNVSQSISIKIPFPCYIYDTTIILNMIGQNVQSLHLTNVVLKRNDMKILMKILKNNESLQELSLYLLLEDVEQRKKTGNKDNLIDYFALAPDKLMALTIVMDADQTELHDCIGVLIGRQKNLRYLNVNIMPKKKKSSIKLINIMEKSISNTILSLELLFPEIMVDTSINFGNFIKKCLSLREIKILCLDETKNLLGEEVIKGLDSCVKNLCTFQMSFYFPLRFTDLLNNLLPKFQTLVTFDISQYIKMKVNFEAIIALVRSSQRNLRVIEFKNCKLDEYLFYSINFRNFHHLTAMKLYNLSFDTDVYSYRQFFVKLIHEEVGKKLTHFDITSCNLPRQSEGALAAFLYSCIRLETFAVDTIKASINLFDGIVSGLQSSKNTLKYIYITNCLFNNNNGQQLASLLMNFEHVQKFILKGNQININIAYNILESLFKSRWRLGIFIVDCLNEGTKQFEDIEQLAAHFPLLNTLILSLLPVQDKI